MVALIEERRELFLNKLNKIFDGNIITYDEYQNKLNKMTFLCKLCNKTFISSTDNLFGNNKNRQKFKCCSSCVKKILLNQSAQSKVPTGFILMEEYVNNKTKMKIKHKKCGNIFIEKLLDLNRNKFKCPFCDGEKRNNKQKTTKDFIIELKEKFGGEFLLISKEYINNKTELEFKHSKCGKTFWKMPNRLFLGHGCSHCNPNKQKTTEDFIKDLYQYKPNQEFEIISKYKNNKSKIKIKHKNCGNTFFLQAARSDTILLCPTCHFKMSKGEKIIFDNLNYYSIKFKREKKFKECKNKSKLPFDFFLPDYNLLIEYDGIQHYKESKQFKKKEAKEQFILQQKKDKIKNNWVENQNKYSLIRIPYFKSKKIKLFIKMILNNKLPKSLFKIIKNPEIWKNFTAQH